MLVPSEHITAGLTASAGGVAQVVGGVVPGQDHLQEVSSQYTPAHFGFGAESSGVAQVVGGVLSNH
jgi:hypothetical protein